MCVTCGIPNCSCDSTPVYNWFGVGDLPCTDCDPVIVCARKLYSLCVSYSGTNLTNTGINTNDTLNDILQKLDNIKQAQDLTNVKLLANINSINDRLNILESGTHIPYTLL